MRCFLNRIEDQCERYKLISQFLAHHSEKYLAEFEYVEQGVFVRSDWFPILKMEWIEGQTLDRFIERNLYRADEVFVPLAEKFELMCETLRKAGCAHGDLQHGNIIVTENFDLKLVDYDGMFVPGMEGMHCSEAGHRNYQHPSRSEGYFDSTLDLFSELIISFSLRMLAIDPTLYTRLCADDSMLLKQGDFASPEHSTRFYELENHESAEIQRMAKLIRWQCSQSIGHLLPIDRLPMEAPLQTAVTLPAVPLTQSREVAPVRAKERHFYAEKWWRLFLDRPHLHEGIPAELLRPGRKFLWNKRILPLPNILLMIFLLSGAYYAGSIYFPGTLFFVVCRILSALHHWQLNLYFHGRPSRGQIVSVHDNNSHFLVGVSFCVLDGRGCMSRMVEVTKVSKADRGDHDLVQGQEVTVLYAANAPHNFVIYDYGLFEIRPDPPPPLIPNGNEGTLSSWWRMFLSQPNLCEEIELELQRPLRHQLRATGRTDYAAAWLFLILAVFCLGGSVGIALVWGWGELTVLLVILAFLSTVGIVPFALGALCDCRYGAQKQLCRQGDRPEQRYCRSRV